VFPFFFLKIIAKFPNFPKRKTKNYNLVLGVFRKIKIIEEKKNLT